MTSEEMKNKDRAELLEYISAIEKQNLDLQKENEILHSQLVSLDYENVKAENRKKQATGIANAKAKGVKFGRPCKPLPDDFEKYVELWVAKEISAQAAAKLCGISVRTFYTKAKEYRSDS